jgi:hypothetical protein
MLVGFLRRRRSFLYYMVGAEGAELSLSCLSHLSYMYPASRQDMG